MDKTKNTTATPKKKKRVQGKLDRDMIFRLLTQDNPPKKKEIAVMAGSQAVTEEGKINALNNVVRSGDFQARLKEWRSEQKSRLLEGINKARDLQDFDLLDNNQAQLADFILKSERLLQESYKQDEDKEKGKKVVNIYLNEDSSTLMSELKKLQEQQITPIEGELV